MIFKNEEIAGLLAGDLLRSHLLVISHEIIGQVEVVLVFYLCISNWNISSHLLVSHVRTTFMVRYLPSWSSSVISYHISSLIISPSPEQTYQLLDRCLLLRHHVQKLKNGSRQRTHYIWIKLRGKKVWTGPKRAKSLRARERLNIIAGSYCQRALIT
ncbi:hypothetical protein K501DRAFT_270163 [Backusella circina FSU 941]|nr:hypothetical protein K501DRAFT_270163 [Backusella circina FSU 941]